MGQARTDSLHVAKMAEQLGIDGDKALQLLLEYERQQALRKAGR